MANKRKETDTPILNARLALANVGIYAMYGCQKGHGFWLYKCSIELAKALTTNFNPAAFWEAVDKNDSAHEFYCMKNDGVKSGNPSFWMFKDALKLAETQKSESVAMVLQ